MQVQKSFRKKREKIFSHPTRREKMFLNVQNAMWGRMRRNLRHLVYKRGKGGFFPDTHGHMKREESQLKGTSTVSEQNRNKFFPIFRHVCLKLRNVSCSTPLSQRPTTEKGVGRTAPTLFFYTLLFFISFRFHYLLVFANRLVSYGYDYYRTVKD